MSEQKTYELIHEPEYAQSANSLFHFVNREEYLFSAIDNKCLSPRYCYEDIGYLNLRLNGIQIQRIAVLEKCFCDIPLHQLSTVFELEVLNKDQIESNDHIETELKMNTHPKFYGSFAIAFAKEWCIKNNLQPIHYVNPQSALVTDFRKMFEYVWCLDDLDDSISNGVINKLAFIKPLKGKMSRIIEGKSVFFNKNFHDEREWRFVPPTESLETKELNSIIFKPMILNEINEINNRIAGEEYKIIHLNFEYSDIRYLIVPTESDKNKLIQHILDLEDSYFTVDSEPLIEKAQMISKILVLNELSRDW